MNFFALRLLKLVEDTVNDALNDPSFDREQFAIEPSPLNLLKASTWSGPSGVRVAMHLLYSLNRIDLVRGQYLHTSFWRYLVPICIILCVLTFVSLVGGDVPIEFSAGFFSQFVSPLLLGLFLTLALRFILVPWRVARHHSQNPLFYRDLELFIDNTGIRVKGPRTDAKWEWTDLRGFKEGTSIFLICVSRSMHYVVPKRALSVEESGQFRDLLEQHLKKM